MQNVPEIITSSNLNGSGDNKKPIASPLYDRGVYQTFFLGLRPKFYITQGRMVAHFVRHWYRCVLSQPRNPMTLTLIFKVKCHFQATLGIILTPNRQTFRQKLREAAPKVAA